MKAQPLTLNNLMNMPLGFKKIDQEMILNHYFNTDLQSDIAFKCKNSVFHL